MFSSPLSLHYTGSRNQTETHNDDTTAVTAVNLVLDSLTPKLAKQLSREVHDLCFGSDGQIHASVSKLTVRLREPQQRVTVRMASDVAPHCILANVRIPTISITKRGEDQDDDVERKSRKVAPAAETLRATLNCLMLPESHEARAFLCQMPGKTFVFEFGDEERQLDFGSDDDEGTDNGEPTQARLRNTGGDDEAGDILEEQLIVTTLASFNVEISAKKLTGFTVAERARLLEFAQDVKVLNANPNTKASDLPALPDFLFAPASRTKSAVKKLAATVEAQEAKPARAKRRSSSKFTNTPKLAGKVTKAKGRKRQAVN